MSALSTTPAPETRASVDHTWVDVAENCEQIFALSGGYSEENATDELQEVLEERLRRPVGSSLASRYGVSSDPSSLINRDPAFSDRMTKRSLLGQVLAESGS